MTELQQVIAFRLSRSRETLDDARLLAQKQRWISCVNRLYYACFYAVSALLWQQGLSSSKHIGIKSLFNQHYGKTGKVPEDSIKLYNMLFRIRNKGDYEDFIEFYEADVMPLIARTEEFINHIAYMLE